jgi:hypothetical protein
MKLYILAPDILAPGDSTFSLARRDSPAGSRPRRACPPPGVTDRRAEDVPVAP